VWFGDGFLETAIHPRHALAPGVRLEGPAVVEQADTTTVVPPGWAGQADRFGNLVLRRAR
jgi:N-methylhydantoinase A/oxoprolinase/acetone carboxylase beta subunit